MNVPLSVETLDRLIDVLTGIYESNEAIASYDPQVSLDDDLVAEVDALLITLREARSSTRAPA